MGKRKTKASFSQRLLWLISEPEFIQYENILREPNFFRIVGRTHYERWHSAFFGWLLDPNGSHLLDDYVLRRFLLLFLDENCLRSSQHQANFLQYVLPRVVFEKVQVAPTEGMPTETSVSGIGRFDVFLSADYVADDGVSGKLNIIFEFKIDSPTDAAQSTKYANWLMEAHPEDLNLLAYVTPKLLHSSEDTVGDARWYCMDYQLLNDKLLMPLLDHPRLNEKVKPFIVQYIKNLKSRHKGTKMAITNEEKRLATTLYEKYSDVFDSLYDALVTTGTIDFTTADIDDGKGRATGRISVRIDSKIFANETVRLLFQDVLKYIVDKGFVRRLPLPWGTSKTRYILTNATPAMHPNERAFFYPVVYKDYTIESHYARQRAVNVLSDLCEKLEIQFEEVET